MPRVQFWKDSNSLEDLANTLGVNQLHNVVIEQNPNKAKGEIYLRGRFGTTLDPNENGQAAYYPKKYAAHEPQVGMYLSENDSSIRSVISNAAHGTGGFDYLENNTYIGSGRLGNGNANGLQAINWAEGTSYIAFVGAFNDSNIWVQETTNITNLSNVQPTGNSGILDVEFLNGYYMAIDANNLYISALNNPYSWNAADFAAISYSGDKSQGIVKVRDHFFVMGRYTTEIWYDAQGATFPFARLPNGVLPIGLADPAAYTRLGDMVYILGCEKNGRTGIFALSQQGYKRVSNNEIDFWLSRIDVNTNENVETRVHLSSIGDRHGKGYIVVTYMSAGSNPLVPELDRTYVLDITTGSWSRWSTTGFYTNNYCYTWFASLPDRSTSVAYAAGPYSNGVYYLESRRYVGDDVNVWYSKDGFSNLEPVIKKEIISPPVSGEDQEFFFHRLRLEMESHVPDPSNVNVSFSDDHGVTWVQLEPKNYANTDFVEWFQLGSSSDRTFKIESNTNSLFVCTGAFVDVTPGTRAYKYTGRR